jgi:hypothetical protein
MEFGAQRWAASRYRVVRSSRAGSPQCYGVAWPDRRASSSNFFFGTILQSNRLPWVFERWSMTRWRLAMSTSSRCARRSSCCTARPSGSSPTASAISVVFRRHVTLGFPRGTDLSDPAGVLQGTGKTMRHITLEKRSDLERPEIRAFLRKARQHAGLNRARPGMAEEVVTRVKQKSASTVVKKLW